MDAGIIIRVLLVITIAGMAAIALVYLRQRELEFRDTIGWGLLTVLVPLLGPFLVILSRPGEWRVKTPPAEGELRPARPHVFALAGPRRRRTLRPISHVVIEEEDLQH